MNILARLNPFRIKFDPARPIGDLGSVDGWKSLPIKACDEQLVSLGSFGDYPLIATSSIYRGERQDSPYPLASLDGSLFTVFVRKSVAKRLMKATKLLPQGHMFLVWDAYRPLSVQRSLFEYFVHVLENKGTSHEQAIVDAQKFVSIPSDDPSRPPPHNTGGAVDLTIIRFPVSAWKEMVQLGKIVSMKETDDNWQTIYSAEMRRVQLIRQFSEPLDMGTMFDEVSAATSTQFFELLAQDGLDDRQRQCRDNRRLLCNILSSVGFSNYPEEWWHFDFGNQFDAARTGRTAIYGPARLSTENAVHENIRKQHYTGCRRMLSDATETVGAGWKSPPQIDQVYSFVKDVALRTGDLRETRHPQGASL